MALILGVKRVDTLGTAFIFGIEKVDGSHSARKEL